MNAYTLFAVLILIASLLLILVIMVQNPKGGGLGSSFGAGQMLGGVKQTNDFLEKSTWTLVAALVGLILLSNFVIPRGTSDMRNQTELNKAIDSAPQLEAPNETSTGEDNNTESQE